MKPTRMTIAADRLSLKNCDGNDVTDYVIALLNAHHYIFHMFLYFQNLSLFKRAMSFLRGV